MLHDIFKSIGGVSHYGVISMVIFLLFFALLTLYALSLRKKDVEDFSRMPLEDHSKESDDNQES